MIRLDLANLLTGVLLAALLLLGVRALSLAAQRDNARAEVAELRAQIVAAEVEARRRALDVETRHAADMQELADQLSRELSDAQKTHDGVVADLERGTVRLRAQWQGCEARLHDLPETTNTSSGIDALAQLRNAGVADLLRVGAECDAKLRAWQDYARTVMGVQR